MGAKFTDTVELPGVLEELAELQKGAQIIVAPLADDDSELAIIAAVHEFGATITPKSGKYLSIPLTREAKEAGSPTAFSDLQFIPGRAGKSPVLGRRQPDGSVEALFALRKEVIIPERSYLRGTADDSGVQSRVADFYARALERVIDGSMSADQAFDALGLKLASEVRARISGGIAPDNAPLTLALKHGGLPLVDSGRLQQSISHEVVR